MHFFKASLVNLLLVVLICSGQEWPDSETFNSSDSSVSSTAAEISSSTMETASESSTGVRESSSSQATESSNQPISDASTEPSSSSISESSVPKSSVSESSSEISSSVLESSDSSTESSQLTSEAQTESSSIDSIPSSNDSPESKSDSSSEFSSGSEGPSENSQSSSDSASPTSSEPEPSISSEAVAVESESAVDSSSTFESSESSTSPEGEQSVSSVSSEDVPTESEITSESNSSFESSTAASSIESEESSETNEFTTSTEPLSSESPEGCFIPDCRWCDHLDLETCECYKVAIDCLIGTELSEDECSCIEIPGFNSSVSEEPSSIPEISETESSPSPCFPIECPRKTFWNQNTCSCECLKKKMCKKHLTFNPATCECEHMTTTIPAINTTTPFVCSLPSCRWCDVFDEENCACHKTYLDCSPGFQLSSDKCECIKSETSETSQSGLIESPSECVLPKCRPCDVLDIDNCACHRKIVECAEGFELSDDRCGCIKSVSTSENCPGLECPRETFIDEKRCECISEECKHAQPCRKNLVMDPNSCECFCNLSPWQCKYPQVFDRKNCKCRSKNEHYDHEDPENCDYDCVQKEKCHKNFIFDYNKCECVCDSRKSTKKCPEGTKFDKSVCDCVECLDFDDPQCTCDCDEILDCPGNQIFNFIGCECMCPKTVYCEKGFELDERTCECGWRGYGHNFRNNHHGRRGIKGGY